MIFKNLFSIYNRYYLLFPVALIVGLSLGLIIPVSIIESIITPFAQVLIRIMLYVSIPYFFFALIITTYELISIEQFKGFLKIFFISSFFLFLGILSIGIIIMAFIPSPSLVPLVQNLETIPILSFSLLMENLFPDNALKVFSLANITPLLLLALILGIATKAELSFKHSFLETINGIRTTSITVLRFLLPWFVLISGILAIDKTGSIKNFAFLSNFLIIIIMLTGISLALIFIVFPILLRVFNVQISISSWFSRVIPSIVVAFTSGTVVAAGGLLLYADLPDNPRRKIIDTVVSFSFVFARVGVALVISIGYIFLYKIFNVETIFVVYLLVIILCSILLSFAAGVMSFPIIAVGIATLSQIGFISIQELYVIMIPLIPLLSGFAASIDASCCSFLNLLIQHKMAQKYPAPFGTA